MSDRPGALIETMRAEHGRVALLPRHLARLAASAEHFGFACDVADLERAVAHGTAAVTTPARARLLLARSGAWSLTLAAAPTPRPLTVALVPLADPDDWRLRHKTSSREPYVAALARARATAADEAVLVRADGLLTEGSFTTLFVRRDGVLLTPPTYLGLLPGVLRAELLASGQAREAELTAAHLAHGFLLGNALRGLIPARLPDSVAPVKSARP